MYVCMYVCIYVCMYILYCTTNIYIYIYVYTNRRINLHNEARSTFVQMKPTCTKRIRYAALEFN